ncbi:EAL domain-containing protein [Thiorhodococcus mannitoliphagus]|uniref:cyclic-guanylate-specific phosphodiesterase n=1 Tax=Thiorhodococcus mannitoliphagus TaxID=329406 RepID=A0A6P1DPE1_9GAMM|nr:EAL domain-containing protein [Thiorhodococcus mannitoliphagus]NEX19789.1 EAL domain-containing protein [Thiorhodococcus mannitoliphagus]
MRVLHVEDTPTDADLTKRLCTRQAPEIALDLVTSQTEARERLQGVNSYDLALVDLRLPDGSGLELLTWIREQQLPLAVVMLTGSGDQESAIASLQAGADDYLTKDVDALERLPATLRDARKRFVEAHRRRARPLRVLYAEHNPADIDLTRRHLARHAPHIRLTVVSDVQALLARLPAHSRSAADFDLVLLDYRLPGLDALEAVKVLRAERGLDIPIVMVSGQGNERVATRAIHLGVNDFVSKHQGYLHQIPATLEKAWGQVELARERANLQATSERLALALAASPVVLYTRSLAARDLPLTWVSENVARLLGHTPTEMLQRDWWTTRVHPDDREETLARLNGLLKTGRMVHSYRFFDGQGQVRWIHDELDLVGTGESGEATGAWRDVTEPKQVEQVRETRMSVLDALIKDRPLADILGEISQRLEAIHPYMRIVIETQSDARLPAEPITTDASPVDWALPFKDEAGKVLGHLKVRYAQAHEPTPAERDLVGEFARMAGRAVAHVITDTRLRQAAALFDATREGFIITDLDAKVLAVNRAFTEITGYTEAEILGRTPRLLRSNRQDRAFYQAMWASISATGHWQGEIWNRRKNGEAYPLILSISTVYDSQRRPSHYVGVMTDISRLKESEARLEHLVHYDPLTNLPNRRLLQSRLQHAVDHADRQGHRVGVLFIDLDRFKTVNDSLGHPIGDELLQALAQRLSARLREDDTLGRLGGDELLLLIEHLERPADAAEIAESLLSLLEHPFRLPSGPEIYMGASIGISLYPDDGDTVTDLIKHADVAMYQAKEEGRCTYRFYTPSLTRAAKERLALEARLRRALANDEFVLYYQPQFETDSGRLIGCEALARWRSPEEGLVSPARFIPLAEETGLIVPLGEWALRTACAQGMAWLKAGFPQMMMAVNLSGRQLRNPELANEVKAVLEQTGLPPQQLRLELTESIIMDQGTEAVERLQTLKALGLGLSIDDFGTGYSSLAYLKRFPIDELKIDQSFVRDIPEDENDMEIAATIIAMARNLKLEVIAEGVETQEQLDFLRRQGCRGCQGYLLGRPVPATDFERRHLSPS